MRRGQETRAIAQCSAAILLNRRFLGLQMVVCQNRGTQFRPPNIIILIIGTPKMVPLILGNPQIVLQAQALKHHISKAEV